MSAVIVERARERAAVEHAERLDQIAVEVAKITEWSEARASELHLLAVGEIAYFRTLPTETVAEAVKRLQPHVSACERQHGVKLLMKRNGSYVRVRRMPDDSAKGRLAEWHNLKLGQSDTVYEGLHGRELSDALRTARLACEEMRLRGEGRFEAFEDPYSDEIRVLRRSNASGAGLNAHLI
ncbi:hypothetical protein [uncultured Sphingomonas sp.]|uniref:hypothetical protein n=1 Tax=uncultured Sphingomonas sp. TaxID=158754 RepID=UPI0025F5CE18|nr:hypothetical protein [uncultured Sphingomonas sp.]